MWDWAPPSSRFFWQLFYIPTSRKYCNHTLKELSLCMTLKALGLSTDDFFKKYIDEIKRYIDEIKKYIEHMK